MGRRWSAVLGGEGEEEGEEGGVALEACLAGTGAPAGTAARRDRERGT